MTACALACFRASDLGAGTVPGALDRSEQWGRDSQGQVVLVALEDTYILCRATQAEFDATQDREGFGSVPWIPPEMKEVIQVAFGCPP